MLLKIEKSFDKFANIIGNITSFVMVLMIFNVTYDVIARYFFRTGSIAMQEMEWHLFSVIILLGISYTLKEDGHVRVDFLYDKLDTKKKAIINMAGVVIFILPFSLLVGISSIDNAYESYMTSEISDSPGGLTNRWIVKALIPLSFLLLIITSIGYFIKNLNLYKNSHEYEKNSIQKEIEKLKSDLEEKENKEYK